MRKYRGRLLLTAALSAIPALACAPALPPAGVSGSAAPLRTASEAAMPSGSLRQDQISVRMVAGALRIEVTPLEPWVLEAAAPDTRARLTRIGEAHREALARQGGERGLTLFLVSFSSAEPGTGFQPDDLELVSRGLRERPLAIRAITPSWGSQRLNQQSTASAVYAFGGSVDLSRDLTVVYREVEDSSWGSKVAVIEAERGRIPRRYR